MAEIRPDKILADLQTKLAKAKTDAEAADIQEEINARQSELVAEFATKSGEGVAFGAKGSFIPSTAPVGTTILQPTYERGVYTKTTITGDKTFDQYGRENLGTSITLYDENGNPLSKEEAAKTETALNFTAAGRDIGFGAGFIAPGVRPDIEFATFNSGRTKFGNAAVMAGLVGDENGNFNNNYVNSNTNTNTNNGNGNGNVGDGTLTTAIDPKGPSTAITVLKSLLRGQGFNSFIIDSSTSFLMSLLSEDIDYDNAISIFLDSKDYTLKSGVKITSPFYEQYGYLNEGITTPKTASELFNFVEGSKGIIQKYGLSSKFLSQDSLKKYVKNNVTAKDLDERANAARLRALNADPAYVQSLRMLGYLGSSADLTDFYLDPAIGKEKLESNLSTGAFTAEALRRANAGIKTDREDIMRFEKLTAGLQAKGLTEAQISQTASEGFQNIANTLQPEVALSNIFEGTNAASTQTIQAELEAEQFMGTESERRKRLKELGTNIFNQSTGMSTGRTTSYNNYSIAGQI